jgi:hypothetical protein
MDAEGKDDSQFQIWVCVFIDLSLIAERADIF